MDCVWDKGLLGCSILPGELLATIRTGTNEQYLQAITRTALDARYTYTLLAHCEALLPHVCASLRDFTSFPVALATIGRLLPYAPYLTPYAIRMLGKESYSLVENGRSDEDLLYLLGLWRLLRTNHRQFRKFVNAADLTQALSEVNAPARYLILRTLQVYHEASDHWFETTLKHYLGDNVAELDGAWDEKTINYRFLTLWEEDRHEKVQQLILATERAQSQTPSMTHKRTISTELVHPSAAVIGDILLPRVTYRATETDSGFISTPTTSENLRRVARSLRSNQPILLSGLSGSGKTLLVRSVAQTLGKLQTMVTLHLNEQSDAKLLLGVYTTGDTPGSFLWKAGVLTTAVQEGRWVLIEDLDRAPNEVLGTLLPLIEKRQLMIPNRKETIYAAEGFRILATVRSDLNHHGEETKPLTHMLGIRHWQNVPIAMPAASELSSIAQALFPILNQLLPQFMTVYERLLVTRQRVAGQSKTGVARSISPRDLFKWCQRVSGLLKKRNNFTDREVDDIYLEALDCFVGALPPGDTRRIFSEDIAEELRVNPQRRDHLLELREVRYDADKTHLAIGRYSLPKSRSVKPADTSFSSNPHTNRMLERVAAAVVNREPLLLVGETGVGKTTAVQHLAHHLGRKLVPFNLSQQSEAGDLLGGFKPVNARTLLVPIKDDFDELFAESFSASKNKQFVDLLTKQMVKGNWKQVCKLWRQALKMVDQQREASPPPREGEGPAKKRKVDSKRAIDFAQWDRFAGKVEGIERKLATSGEAFAFTFVEGNIVKALRDGDWVLLDEINLASPDTLESIADLLDADAPSLLLTEAGEIERVEAHPDFRVFAAMNPATDVGKKDLPPGIRSRFTELYVESPDKDPKSLQSIVRSYLRQECVADASIPADVTQLYQSIAALAEANKLVDGAGQKPHFSLRTLTRTLSYAKHIQSMCSLRRALYEGFQMSFLTFLDMESVDLVQPRIEQHLFGKRTNVTAELRRALRKPNDGRSYVQGHPRSKHWLRQGSNDLQDQPHYIITDFVERNLENLVRASSTRRFPVLIQGPTSSGKTSMIEYLAKRTGHTFTRINNHEHTDLQEYLGTYASGIDGRLQFQEGVLVKALREGHWIVLDELNLAPTDVLEALNRLLDDNRELLIPETQEVVRPHPEFMLFATQNPAGLYGGRKTLSRAFRNRFLELHFDDIPVNELQEILHRRTQLPESRCRRIVGVYKELSILRQENRLFEQKSFATLRDLFRWALRPNDTIEQLAANGFMLLGERVRKPEERAALKSTIAKVMSEKGPKICIDEEALYDEVAPEIQHFKQNATSQGVVWTRAMRRLYVLVARAVANNEPVLLVGETGCGKTTVCQMLAEAIEQELHMINAHQNTETGDLIGSQRPIRNRAAIEVELREKLLNSSNLRVSAHGAIHSTDALLTAYDHAIASADPQQKAKYMASATHLEIQADRTRWKALFEWTDGSLVHAMRNGDFFLLDEISLADDSVLERMNSVLESSRTILLAEKGSLNSVVTAAPGFQFFATMNPGGDYGKRELSPALRNRFTEIWVPALSDMDDVLQIVRAKLISAAHPHADAMVAFAGWFKARFDTSASASISIRDTLAWIDFVNVFAKLNVTAAIVHGAAMVYIDTLGANPAGLMTLNSQSIDEERRACLDKLGQLLSADATVIYGHSFDLTTNEAAFAIGSFSIPRTSESETTIGDNVFTFDPHTTRSNAMRVLRALQLNKPVMLEGSPGVGKTTLVAAIAKAVDMPLTRINLSDQTDLLDLFGSDAPVEGAQTGTFVWRDAPFLRAMKNGDWVLLDEMNLASQSVLEGLNACLDHRGEVFVPELGQSFTRHPRFRLFAAQNPHHQGGGRKGLPASFVNRFTVVYAEPLRHDDLLLICGGKFPKLDSQYLQQSVAFTTNLNDELGHKKSFGANGGPWEFNLRDIERWLTLASSDQGLLLAGTSKDFAQSLFVQRFRSISDRLRVSAIFDNVFGAGIQRADLFCNVSPRTLQVGLSLLSRHELTAAPQELWLNSRNPTGISLEVLQSVMLSVHQRWPVVLVGSAGAGKTKLVERLAACVGADVLTLGMSAETDALDLIGGYEQADPHRQSSLALTSIRAEVDAHCKALISAGRSNEACKVQSALSQLSSAKAASHEELLRLLPEDLVEIIRTSLRQLIDSNKPIDKARFEWIDGPLVDVLQQGKWLVLDNANLCSPSVLDRLNSLLEPHGELIINEHCDADGQARVLRPHPDFRIFLTVDPKTGELSRAMRNRAVELYLFNEQSNEQDARASTDGMDCESAVARLRAVKALCTGTATCDPVRDHLSSSDELLVPSLQQQLHDGLFSPSLGGTIQLSAAHHALAKPENELQSFHGHAISHMQVPADYACVQTLHPLNNQPLVQQSQQSFAIAMALAAKHDTSTLYQLSYEAFNKLRMDRKSTDRLARVWRSLGKGTSSAGKTNSNTVVDAMQNMLEPVRLYLLQQIESSSAVELLPLKVAIAQLLAFVRVFAHTMASDGLDHASLIACLSAGKAICGKVCEGVSGTAASLCETWSSAIAQITTTTPGSGGQGYNILWQLLRPDMPSTMARLQAMLRFEAVVERTDIAMSDFKIPLEQIVDLRQAFNKTLTLGSRGESDLDDLAAKAVAVMPSDTAEQDNDSGNRGRPHFISSFETICQHLALLSMRGVPLPPRETTALEVLALRKTKDSLCNLQDLTDIQRTLRLLRLSSSSSSSDVSLSTSTITSEILYSLSSTESVSLRQMALLEEESTNLARLFASQAHQLQVDSLPILGTCLRNLVSCVQSQNLELPDSLMADVEIMSARHQARAWTAFAVTCLQHFIPEQLFDPVQVAEIHTSVHHEAKAHLKEGLTAIRQFRLLWTGNADSLRARILQDDIQALGSGPGTIEICRPQSSQLSQLHSEFQALMRVIQCFTHDDELSTTESRAWDDLLVIRARLSEQYRPYTDLTAPVCGLIDCLLVARRLMWVAEDENTLEVRHTSLETITPLVNATFSLHVSDQHFLKVHEAHSSRQEQLFWLAAVAVRSGVAPISRASSVMQSTIRNVFGDFYRAWKIELGSEQRLNAAKSSLFKYRGGDDDQDEAEQAQLNELFPSYDDYDDGGQQAVRHDSAMDKAQSLAPRLAELYHAVYNADDMSAEKLFDLLRHFAAISATSPATNRSKKDSIAALCGLQRLTAQLAPTEEQSSKVNVYTEPNIKQSRALVNLVYKLQRRFEDVRRSWPEHATPTEVLRACDQILTFGHAEPLMRYLPSVEKLHATINEWQKVASSEFSAATLLDEITDLIISWRKLELSTWYRMFDHEDEQCRRAAASWWFVAFETIIAASEDAIQRPEGLCQFTPDLIHTLGAFLSNCGLGEYTIRLRLLRDFEAALAIRAMYDSGFASIRGAVANLTSFYTRYETAVSEQLSRRRAKLEKDIRNAVLVASWKDTNILTMKKSAKASHNKLFRVVRKYRQLLAEPVTSIVQAVFAMVKFDPQESPRLHLRVGNKSASDNVAHPWLKPYAELLRDPQVIAQDMIAKVVNISSSDRATKKIETFLHELREDSEELRRETPNDTTGDNKTTVKFLKQRKRKLLASVFKDVQLMGFQPNVSDDVLAQQSTLNLVLAKTTPLALQNSTISVQIADQEFHCLLHVMPIARESAATHNGDLTPAEIARGKSLLESMLQIACEQHEKLQGDLKNVSTLSAGVEQLKNLATSDAPQLVGSARRSRENLMSEITSLSSVLRAASRCVEYQAQLGGKEYSQAIAQLNGREVDLSLIRTELARQPVLPANVSNLALRTIEDRYSEFVSSTVPSTVKQVVSKHHELETVLSHAVNWTGEVNTTTTGSLVQETGKDTWNTIHALLEALKSLPLKHADVGSDDSRITTKRKGKEAWLLEQQSQQQASINMLHLDGMSGQVAQVLASLRSATDSVASLTDISAICHKIIPILDAYTQISSRAIMDACKLHAATSKLAHRLAVSFTMLARQGFCQTSEESQDSEKDSGQAQSGTGLGEGEGGEDISKDIDADEDLSELAQDATSKDKENETEIEKDAVDMADEDLEGEFDEDAGSQGDEDEGKEGDQSDAEVDEEAGHVDEDDGAVDEKTWNDETSGEADKEADKGQGNKTEDVAASGEETKNAEDEASQDQEEQDDADADAGADEVDEDIEPGQTEKADSHMADEQNLELPDDFTMDADKDGLSEISSDDADDLEDITDAPAGDNDDTARDESDVEMGEDECGEAEDTGEATVQDQAEHTSESDNEDAKSDVAMLDHHKTEREIVDSAPADAGQGQDQEDGAKSNGVLSNSEQMEQDKEPEEASAQDGTAEGGSSRQADTSNGQAEVGQEDQRTLPYKQLGDVLKQWYDQHRNIEASKEETEQNEKPEERETMDDARFEHVDDAETEMQAIGAADTDQSRALDQQNAQPIEQVDDQEDPAKHQDAAEQQTKQTKEDDAEGSGLDGTGADLGSRQDEALVGQPMDVDMTWQDGLYQSDTEDLDNMDQQLTATHLDSTRPESLSIEDARRAWNDHESRTRNMAIVLTEHLRLILQPTQATKMRGDFRTGKRLNIKKIIPYIASSYRRDKIWMRRSVPSKRSYQIMLAIDDSESMNESERKGLAFDTLALVSKAMFMLEVGELCIVGFGQNVNISHDFSMPFTSDAGAEVYRQFSFSQTKTDVRALLEQSIELFRTARLKASGSASDLWQLQLIISDGHCEDHPSIRQLVRQAHKEQIMVVFIVIDAAAPTGGAASDQKQSIMDLQEARFNGESELEMIRYLDHFPFRFYLIVRDVLELPTVLAGALRQWFSEVVESG